MVKIFYSGKIYYEVKADGIFANKYEGVAFSSWKECGQKHN